MLRPLLEVLLLAAPLSAQVTAKNPPPIYRGAPGAISLPAPALDSRPLSPAIATDLVPALLPPAVPALVSAPAASASQSAGQKSDEGPRATPSALDAMFDGSEARGIPFSQADLDTAVNAMFPAEGNKLDRFVYAAVFRANAVRRKEILQLHAEPAAFENLLAHLYESLRAAYDADLPARTRLGVSATLEDYVRRFLVFVERDARLPGRTRLLAARARERYLDAPGLVSALAWGRQQKAAIASGREGLREAGFSPEPPSRDQHWAPPAADAAPPSKPLKSIRRESAVLADMDRKRRNKEAAFELARLRIAAARKSALTARAARIEERRWRRAGRGFAGFLRKHEESVDYFLDHTLRMGFAQHARTSASIWKPHPGLAVARRGSRYALTATFETRIDAPLVLAAFRRSIESYWKGSFPEGGSVKRLTTRVIIRTLRPDEDFSPTALRLIDGKTSSHASSSAIALSRKFDLGVPAHEFGHLLGLPDEYVDEYRPEDMSTRGEQDRSSLMASRRGLVLARHIARAVALLRQAGRIKRL